jgi:hypothetical protein
MILCLLPHNKWQMRYPPLSWAIARNIPFFLQGTLVAGLFCIHRSAVPGLASMWLAVALSFAFYLPVVLWSNKKPKIGILMLPKNLRLSVDAGDVPVIVKQAALRTCCSIGFYIPRGGGGISGTAGACRERLG